MMSLANRFSYAFGIVALAFVASNCGGGVGTQDSESTGNTRHELSDNKLNPLHFDDFGPVNVKGTFESAGKTLRFSSFWKIDRKEVTFKFDEMEVGKVDFNSKGDGLFVADSNQTPESKAAIGGLVEALKGLDEELVAKKFGDPEAANQSALGLLFSYADHYSVAPVYVSLHAENVQPAAGGDGTITPMSLGGDGIKYLWQCKRTAAYSSRYAWTYWDDSQGNHAAYLACGLTAPSCEGRCGAGCPCNSWYCLNRYYTQDCMEHDWCLNYNPGDGSTDPFAPNCGDEWSDAADDFISGSSSGW